MKSGKVIRSTGSWYTVINDAGELINCKLKGIFRKNMSRATNPVAVGDIVDFNTSNPGEGIIEKIHERKNYIVRKATKLSKATHVIAANIDQAVVIAALKKPRTSTGFIDRFLTTAEAYHIPSVVVFNKSDLYNDGGDMELLDYYMAVYESAGYTCLITSVPDNKNLDQFKNILKDKVSLISGHSGVGKSAMINAIDPELNLKVGKISDYHQKGKHTTTFAEMFHLSFGGFIVDTPGIKEFGLVEFEKAELGQRFPEFRSRMDQCKFNNCLHLDEPGCAVIAALENSEIGPFRYENYLNMLSNLQ